MARRYARLNRSAGRLQGFAAATLCIALGAQATLRAAQPKAAAKSAATKPVATKAAPKLHLAPLTQQKKMLQALNRLTFGPKPGDEAAVRATGLNAWFERQLHPGEIDDSALNGRLAMFPAMQLSQAQLLERFPSKGELRKMDQPENLTAEGLAERAIYADAEAKYEARLKDKGSVQPPAATAAGANAAAGNMTGVASGVAGGGEKGKGKSTAVPMAPEAVQSVLMLGPGERYGRLIAMSPNDFLAFDAALRPGERQAFLRGMTPIQAETMAAILDSPERLVGAEALESRLVRDVYSERQLQAVMTDFWLNHFSVYVRKNQYEPYLLPAYQRDTVLPNALGNFEKLLVATAQSPAMLVYLDNWLSAGPDSPAAQKVKRVQALRPKAKLPKTAPQGINENYARELMELHTLGVNGGYTQKDVIEVAKCFTGWTIDRRGGQDEFKFEPNRHEPGPKTVLGHVIQEGGENEGLEVLHILATSPATARFISNALAVRFVSDDPPEALVKRMTATFLKSDGDIPAVLSTMFHSKEFFSPEVYRAKVKTPIEFMASALRASDASVTNPLALVQAMDGLGMPIYGMQTPNGYAWTADQWVSSNALISRMNFALVLSGSRLQGTATDWPALLGESGENQAAAPTPQTEARLELLLLGQPAASNTRATVMDQFSNPAAQSQAEQSFKARLTQAKPDAASDSAATSDSGMIRVGGAKRGGAGRQAYQGYQPGTPLDTMAGLLLGSPDFQRR